MLFRSLGRLRPPLSPSARAWTRPVAALATAAGIAVGAFFIASRIQSLRNAAAPRRVAVETPQAVSSEPAAAPTAAGVPAAVASASEAAPAAVSAASQAKPVRAAKRVRTELRQPAEDLRLRAALARIEADRWNARETAGEIFGEGRSSEEEGERLLRQRDYDAAQLAFSRAARLFQQAQELTWEERIRQADLAQAK